MILGFLALLCGLFIGYLTLRALGWLLIIISVTLLFLHTPNANADQQLTVSCTGTNCDGAWRYSANGGGTWQGPYNYGSWIYMGQNIGTEITIASRCGFGEFVTLGSYIIVANEHKNYPIQNCNQGSPPTYYVNGCITNTGPYVVRFIYIPSAGASQTSLPLPPGSYWCIAQTNSSPFTYRFERITYNTDGGTNSTDETPDFPAWTNSVPGPGQTGSGHGGGTIDNNPIGPGAGAGSTNPPTADQTANGLSNLVNVIVLGNNNLAGGIGGLYGALTNMNSLMTNDSGVLRDIKTNTANTTAAITFGNGLLAEIKTNTLDIANAERIKQTNWNNALSNYTYLLTGSGSNTFVTTAAGISNAFWQAATTNLTAVADGTNLATPTESVWNIWKIPIYTNVAKNGPLNLDPRNTTIFTNLASWIRLAFVWIMSIVAITYIHFRVQEEFWNLMHIPGSIPSKGGIMGLLGGAATTVIVTSIALAALPIILAAGYGTIMQLHGNETFCSPLSSAGAAVAGTYETNILAGLALLETFFPLAFALVLGLYMIVFDMTIVVFLVYGALLIRYFTH